MPLAAGKRKNVPLGPPLASSGGFPEKKVIKVFLFKEKKTTF